MLSSLQRPVAFGLALSASVAASLFSFPQAARALNVTVGGTTYDIQLYTGSYNSNASIFKTPANGGRMDWWGNPSLAEALAGQLSNGLSPTYTAGDPVEGPLFATSFVTRHLAIAATKLASCIHPSQSRLLLLLPVTSAVPDALAAALTATLVVALARARRIARHPLCCLCSPNVIAIAATLAVTSLPPLPSHSSSLSPAAVATATAIDVFLAVALAANQLPVS